MQREREPRDPSPEQVPDTEATERLPVTPEGNREEKHSREKDAIKRLDEAGRTTPADENRARAHRPDSNGERERRRDGGSVLCHHSRTSFVRRWR